MPLENNADPSHPSSNAEGSSNDTRLHERKRKRRERDAAGPSNTGNNDSDNDSAEQEIRNIRVSITFSRTASKYSRADIFPATNARHASKT